MDKSPVVLVGRKALFDLSNEVITIIISLREIEKLNHEKYVADYNQQENIRYESDVEANLSLVKAYLDLPWYRRWFVSKPLDYVKRPDNISDYRDYSYIYGDEFKLAKHLTVALKDSDLFDAELDGIEITTYSLAKLRAIVDKK